MRAHVVAAALAALVATDVQADQRLTLEIVSSARTFASSCSVTLFDSGRMNVARSVDRYGSIAKNIGSANETDERLVQFGTAWDAMSNGEIAPPEGAPHDIAPPFVRMTSAVGQKGRFSPERQILLPGTEIPPQMLALFAPLSAGMCLGPDESRADPAAEEPLTDRLFGVERHAMDVFVTVTGADPANDVHCAVRVTRNGRAYAGLLPQGDRRRRAVERFEATTELRDAFDEIAKRFRRGGYLPPEAREEDYPLSVSVPPFVEIGFAERRGSEIRVSWVAVLPGTELPGEIEALFRPHFDGACLPSP